MAEDALRLFGYPQAIVDGEAVDIKSRKGLALLAYLAVTRLPQSRDLLAGLLWPEYDQTRARANLRRTLFNLNRTVIADWLTAEGEMLALRDEIRASVDVVRFDDLTTGGEVGKFEVATELYRDDFLAAYYLPDAAPFDDWAAEQRARLKRVMQQALDALTQRDLDQGAFGHATEQARRQLELDNLRESAWRQLMTALARAGERNEALAEYARCRQILADELGVDPSETTTALATSIRGNNLVVAQEPKVEHLSPATVTETRSPEMPLLAARSPYRGLFAFREDDAELFFGREELTELLVEHVSTKSIVAVIGPSGSGKTSVVYAGLVAQLRADEQWAVVSFRPGMDPFQALSAALTPLLTAGSGPVDQLVEAHKLAYALADNSLSLSEVVGQIRQQRQVERLLLVADQFEELYTLCADADLRQHFLDHLLDLVFSQQYLPSPIFSLVLTLRADFLGQALSHRAFADAIQDSDVKLGPMTRPELTRAIVSPAERRGAAFEPGLVTRMLDDVGDEPGNLPLLEFALDTLWSQQQAALLRHETYEAIGRVEGALARYADEVYASLGEGEQLAARRLFTQLVQPGEGTEDTRRVAAHRDLGDEGWALASRLADARLVITGLDASGEQTAEVVHEALIRCWGRLRTWMREDREFRIWQERLRAAERQWQINGQDDGSVLRGAALSTAESWLAERPADVGNTERAFIQASVDLRVRRQAEAEAAARRVSRLQRRVVYTLATGLLLALVLAGIAGLQWRAANQERLTVEAQARVALSRQLAAQSATHLEHGRLDLAHLLAVEAIHLDRNPESRAALRAAVSQPDSVIQKFVGHEDVVLSALWSGDESQILSASADGTARVWDAQTGEQLMVLEGHTGWLAENAEATWSPDGKWILTSGEEDETVRVWDASTGAVIHVLDGANAFTWIEWSPDGSRILAVGDDLGKVWDAASGDLLTTFDAHDDFIQQGHWNRDGSRVITNSADHTARVWDPQTGEQLLVLAGHEDGVIRARWNPDESRILTAGIDGALKIWDAATGAELLALAGHDDFIWEARWNHDGTRLLTTSGDGTVKIWEAITGEPLQTLTGHESTVWDAAWSPDERLILTSGGEDGTARVWDAATGEEVARFGHADAVGPVRWRSDGRAVLTASEDGAITLWAVGEQPARTYLPELRGSPVEYYTGEWSQDDRLLLSATEDPRGAVILWDTQTGEIVGNFAGMENGAFSAHFSADESQVLAAGWEGTVRTWEADTGVPLLALNGHSGDVWEVSWDGGEDRILTAGEDGEARIWDALTGEQLLVYREHGDEIWEALWHPDDRRVVTGSKDGVVRIWDSESGETLVVLDSFEDGVGHIAWNRVGDRLLTGDEGGGARVWDADSGDLIFDLAGHTMWVTSGGWNNDESRILTVGADAARIWDAESGDLLLTMPGEENTVEFGLWNGDGSQVALAVDIVGIQLWDVQAGEMLEQIPVDRYTDRLQWSHDEKRIAAMGNQGIRQYLMDIDELIDIACQRAGRTLSEEEWANYLGETLYAPQCSSQGSSH